MADIEQLKKYGYTKGYEDLVKVSSDDLFPEYIEKEADESIKSIKEIKTENSVSFAFITDNHYIPSRGHDVNFGRTINAYKKIAEATGINKILLGGDHTVDGKKEIKLGFFKDFRKHFENIDYFPVNGNHDDGTFWDMVLGYEKSENHLTHKDLYDVFYNHLLQIGAEVDGDDVLYYFYNDAETKTRYIFLDVGDIPYIYDDGKLKYRGQDTMAMSQKQTDWLINKALKFDEDGWSVIFVSHWAPLHLNEEREANDNKYLSHLTDMVDAYKNGEDLEKEYYDGDFKVTVKAKFSGYKRADIIAFFIGHNHVDRVSETKSGIPVISTGNAGMFNSGVRGDGTFEVMRYDGGKSEILFDIVTVDKASRKIYMTRVGEGEDRKIDY